MIPRKRQKVFVCSSIIEAMIVTEVIDANTAGDATKSYQLKHNTTPGSVTGPFYQSKTGVLDSEVEIKFAGKTMSGLFQDWRVTAMILVNPPNSALIMFDSRIDEKIAPKPKSIIARMDEIDFKNAGGVA